MSEYREVLLKWARDVLPAHLDVAKVTDVSFDFDKGYGGGCDTCGYGADEDKMTVWIYYQTLSGDKDYESVSQDMFSFESGMGELLRELFKIAEERE